ncbi:hypothetical protein [Polyangium sp. 6x1]|uniref:RICIN domain-containing protein n=1 Tax=Polyangium sp. 6x1 TaxID=3042689 RepID=UPI0024829C09|nr:hypothetical protein [Polyangium sp. 6x1]MDI1446360.1 hypothetical protein [Polyangium sp. 6x1]
MKLTPSRRVFPHVLSLFAAALLPLGCAADGAPALEAEEEVSEARQELVTQGLFVAANGSIHRRGAIGPATGNDWTVVDGASGVTAMAVHNSELYVIAGGYLYKRDTLGSGGWVAIGEASGGTAMASFHGSLYMTTSDGLFRRGSTDPGTGNDWTWIGPAQGVTAMTSHNGMLIVASSNGLWVLDRMGPTTAPSWSFAGEAYGVTGLASYNGSLYAATNGALHRRGALGAATGNDWTFVGEAYGVVAMAASAGGPVMGPARCGDKVRLRSWQGDYLHRPDDAHSVTTWSHVGGSVWAVECTNNGTIQLRSWKGDYLHRPAGDVQPAIGTWDQGEWTVVPTTGGKFKLRSWRNDFLHRPAGRAEPRITAYEDGELEWTAEVIVLGTSACGDSVRVKSWKGDYLSRAENGVTTGDRRYGSIWRVECMDNGMVQLRSWKGDYLHRPDSDAEPRVTTWDQGGWWPENYGGEGAGLRSWRGDFLHRPDTPQGVTTWTSTAWGIEPVVDLASVPTMRFVNQDVNNDGTRELVLVTENPGGGGFLVYDPFVIAEALPHLGYSYGAGTDFWETLSPAQQTSLKETVSDLLPHTDLGTAIDAHELVAARSSIPNQGQNRTYHVDTYEGDFEASRNGLRASGSAFTLTGVSQNALGVDTTLTIGPSGSAAAMFRNDGMAFGAEANLYVVTRSVGDPTGTTGAITTGVGVGLYGELKFGENDQYGFSVPLLGTPVGVTLYVKGSDAVQAWNAVRGSSAGSLFEASRHLGDLGIAWSHDVHLVSLNAFDDAALVVSHQADAVAGAAYIWTMDAGRQSVIELGGTASTVGATIDTAVDLASDKMISPSVNAAGDLAQWSKTQAGSAVISAFDSAIGDISDAIDDVEDFFCSIFC